MRELGQSRVCTQKKARLREVILCDFEFISRQGKRQIPVCMVAKEAAQWPTVAGFGAGGLDAWIESPEPGISTSTTVSAWWVISTSACPTPTTRGRRRIPLTSSAARPGAWPRRVRRASAAGHRADEDAGVEEVIRQADAVAERRSLREDGEPGSIESTAASRSRPRARYSRVRRHVATPGGPVKPTMHGVAGLGTDLAHERPGLRGRRSRPAISRTRGRACRPASRLWEGFRLQTLRGSHGAANRYQPRRP